MGKRCSSCEALKPLDEFSVNKTGKQAGIVASVCKACKCIKAKERRQRNLKAARIKGLESYYRNRDSALEYKRRHYEENREAERARTKAYIAANPDIARSNNHARRARLLDAEGKYSAADVSTKLAEQGGKCFWCEVDLDGVYHVDHIVPVSKGGSNWPSNICCSCPPCNLRKGATLPEQFRRRLSESNVA